MQFSPGFVRLLPSVIVCAVLGMLLSLYCGWLDPFFWAAQHAHVQGIDYFALPKSFLNLLEHRSPYDSWQGTVYGPYATWYLAHPLFSVLVMPFFSFFPPWLSYVFFVLFSLSIMVYCGYLYAKNAPANERGVYYALFLLAFPVYWMFYVGNMHAPLVLSLALILLSIYELAYAPEATLAAHRKLLFGLLLSFFTKPVVILLLPALLIARETRRTTWIALVIYAIGSFIALTLPWMNPESVGWTKRFLVMFDLQYIKDNLNIYKNQFVLSPMMKDNVIHWLNLIAQSGYRFNHIENFGFPLFLDGLLGQALPGYVYFLPLLFCQILAFFLFFIRDSQMRLVLLLWMTLLNATSYFLSYNTVWEYQYASMLPVVATLFRLRKTAFVSATVMRVLLASSLFYYLPSFYWMLDKSQMDAGFISMVHVSREAPTLILYVLIGYGVVSQLFRLCGSITWLKVPPFYFEKV